MQLLKKEVEAVSNLTRCMDAFTSNHTRLVVIVDGLDSCEQDKLLHVLDMVSFLYRRRNNNNNNKHDNVYGAVIMAEPLRESTRFIW